MDRLIQVSLTFLNPKDQRLVRLDLKFHRGNLLLDASLDGRIIRGVAGDGFPDEAAQGFGVPLVGRKLDAAAIRAQLLRSIDLLSQAAEREGRSEFAIKLEYLILGTQEDRSMAARKKARSAARKSKKAAARKAAARKRPSSPKAAPKKAVKRKAAKKQLARSRAAKRKPTPKSAETPSHLDPLRESAKSFAIRHLR